MDDEDNEMQAPAGEDDKKGKGERRTIEAPDNNPMLYMDDILDKLKLLDYETKFCAEKNIKPILRTYFAVPSSNSNEQFYVFTSLVAWLMTLNNNKITPPNQYDDPNAVSTNILQELKKMGMPSEFAPAKLKQGHGEAVCVILSGLLDKTLQATGFVFKKPIYPDEGNVEEAPVDNIDDATEDVPDAATAGDEEEELLFSDLHVQREMDARDESEGLKGGNSTKVDPAVWTMELERMTPHLKVTMRADNKEWRTHVETTADLQKVINTVLPDASLQLGKLAENVSKAMDKIATREKHINSHYEHLILDYRAMQEKLQGAEQNYAENSENVTKYTNELAKISEELEHIKSQMDDRGSSMTDTAPLVKMKQAMQKLKGEIKQMELRIGTVEHTLLHAKLRNKAHSMTGNEPLGQVDTQEEYEY